MVESTLICKTMILKYVSGVESSGKQIVSTVKLGNIKISASDEDMFSVGKAILGAIGKEIVSISKTMEYDMGE